MSVHRCSVACPGVFDDHEFALCLTHDVDRVAKTYQSLYYAAAERRAYHLRTLFSDAEPYWQFEDVMALEDDLEVRSTFYFLQEKTLREKSPAEWLRPRNWIRHTGYYDVTDPAIADVIRDLDDGGWEVGVHGSYDSYADPDRLAREKRTLEEVLGHPITGGRQHFLNLDIPETWRYHREAGLKYDASFGSTSTFGLEAPVSGTGATAAGDRSAVPDDCVGTGPFRPFGDDFLVFPLTVMEEPLVEEAGGVDAAWTALQRLLSQARDRGAVVTVLWHPRLFNETEFPGYRRLYEKLIVEARSLDAWIGPVEDAYREIVESGCRRWRDRPVEQSLEP